MKMRINEIKKLYHGTDKKIKTFDFEKAGKAKDFGRGFSVYGYNKAKGSRCIWT